MLAEGSISIHDGQFNQSTELLNKYIACWLHFSLDVGWLREIAVFVYYSSLEVVVLLEISVSWTSVSNIFQIILEGTSKDSFFLSYFTVEINSVKMNILSKIVRIVHSTTGI